MRTLPILIAATLVATGPVAIAAEPAAPASGAHTGAGFALGERLPAPADGQLHAGYREIDWPALIPAAWDPRQAFKGIDLDKLQDNDPRANDALALVRKSWASAPVEPALNKARVRIAGFVVPLEYRGRDIVEFLLVPYFGACIHLPPPPPNQIIHVFASQPIARKFNMRPIWAQGTLETAATTTDLGATGYSMQADEVLPYRTR